MTLEENAVTLPAEFTMIARHFRPLAGPGALGLADDAAVFTPPPGRELVISADTMVAGVHYLPDDPAFMIARKLLRVNLSDIAAMGATPFAYLLALSMPRGTPEAWLADFAAGLGADQAEFGIHLLGGDTTSTPGPVSLTVTMLGHAAHGAAWRRSGARAGDDIWVTGIIGRGVMGLQALRGERPDPDGTLAAHYRLPQPRLGLPLHGIVSAAMDISDGLVQDCGHMARASGVAITLLVDAVPVPAGAPADFVASGGAGGDDYELLFAAHPGQAAAIEQAAHAIGTTATKIGKCSAGAAEVTGRTMEGGIAVLGGGWSHF
jgi:thiamine-monophosphate kinase